MTDLDFSEKKCDPGWESGDEIDRKKPDDKKLTVCENYNESDFKKVCNNTPKFNKYLGIFKIMDDIVRDHLMLYFNFGEDDNLIITDTPIKEIGVIYNDMENYEQTCICGFKDMNGSGYYVCFHKYPEVHVICNYMFTEECISFDEGHLNIPMISIYNFMKLFGTQYDSFEDNDNHPEHCITMDKTFTLV